ncbi:conserved hypothetical protein [Sphingomonas sp. EC-HK361]|uniref:YdeI/OmpD-associated family protein n=1 Tax=Sphingomonas sp. EC-HK361 TaxID=2038397 RepID=UPI00125AD3A5|nr:YdeI/OmpD-associated family protein [Sphingomonas sp. EC-HK361]VVS98710.1 conserved hypothetical protein [Sphingomonas sp. EC-HK361]
MPAPSITYTTTLADEGAIPVPFDQRALFGKARPPVVVTINGHSYRSTIAIMNGATFVPLRRSNREAASVAASDTIEVTLTLDTAPRAVEAPAPLAEALAAAALRARWDALSVTQRREDAESVTGARRDETRERRIAAIVARVAGQS